VIVDAAEKSAIQAYDAAIHGNAKDWSAYYMRGTC